MARDRQRAKQRRARREKSGGLPAPNPIERENVARGIRARLGRHRHRRGQHRRRRRGRDRADDGSDHRRRRGRSRGPDRRGVRRARGRGRRGRGGDRVRRPGRDRRAPRHEVDEDVVARRDKRAQVRHPTPARPRRAASASSRSCAPPGPSCSASSGPTAVQVGQATAVVLGFVVIAGLYLGARRRRSPRSSSTSSSRPPTSFTMYRWYVVNTKSGHEKKVKQNLEHRIVSLGQARARAPGRRPHGDRLRDEGRPEGHRREADHAGLRARQHGPHRRLLDPRQGHARRHRLRRRRRTSRCR